MFRIFHLKRRMLAFALSCVLILQALVSGPVLVSSSEPTRTLYGNLHVVYGEDFAGYEQILTSFRADSGERFALDLSPNQLAVLGGSAELGNLRVELTLARTLSAQSDVPLSPSTFTIRRVDAGQPVAYAQGITGSHKWVNVLCKFSDIADEPMTPASVDTITDNVFPFIANFHDTVSSGRLIISAMDTLNWTVMARPQSYYFGLSVGDALDMAAQDCVDTVDGSIDFSQYWGVNFFFNRNLFTNGAAYGGGVSITADGVNQYKGATWLSHQLRGVPLIAHEMGHAYGFPHTTMPDNDSNVYDNPWDVMSAPYSSFCVYLSGDCIPRLHNAANRVDNDWLPPARIYSAPVGVNTITLDRSSLTTSPNHLTAVIPLNANETLYLETRVRLPSSYDASLPPNGGVLVWMVDNRRWDNPSLVGAITDNSAAAKAALTVGESYTDYANNVSVSVNEVSNDGYQITIRRGSANVSGTPPRFVFDVTQTRSGNNRTFVITMTNVGGPATRARFGSETQSSITWSSITPAANCQITGSTNANNRSFDCEVAYLGSGQSFTATLNAQQVPGTLQLRLNTAADQRTALGSVDTLTIGDPWSNLDRPGVYNPANAAYLLRNSLTSGASNISFLYGSGGADIIPLSGDWNGDGLHTQGIYVKSTGVFALSNTLNGGPFAVFPYGPGNEGFLPLVGDWDANGTDTIGVYNPANGYWLLNNQNASTAPNLSFVYGGGAGYLPLTGDWDNNGTDTPGLYSTSNSVFILSNTFGTTAPFAVFPYGTGNSGQTPVVGNWDGANGDSIGVVTPSGTWLLINQNASIAPQITFNYGGSGLIPLVGRWSGSDTTAPDRESGDAPEIAPTFAP